MGTKRSGRGRLAQGRERFVEAGVEGAQGRLELPHGAPIEVAEGAAKRLDGLGGGGCEVAGGGAEGGGVAGGGVGHGRGV